MVSAGSVAGSSVPARGVPEATSVARVIDPVLRAASHHGAAVVGVGDERETARRRGPDEDVGAIARGQDERIPAGRPAEEGAVLGDLNQLVAVEAQRQDPGRAGVDDPPALGGAGRGGDGGLVLPIDQQQPALAAHRSVGGARRDDGAACVEGDVGDQHQPVRCAEDLCAAVDDQPAGQSAEQLVGDHAVVVRVVPVGAGRVVGGDAVEVVERRSRFDPHEGVVAGALRGDAKAVGVQVGRLVEPVGQSDGELVAGADAQSRAGGASVEAERGGVATGQSDAGRCGQLDRQPAVAAVEHRRLEQLGAGGVGQEGPGDGVRGGGGDPSRDSGGQPDRAQASEDQGASTADRGGLHRRSVRRL